MLDGPLEHSRQASCARPRGSASLSQEKAGRSTEGKGRHSACRSRLARGRSLSEGGYQQAGCTQHLRSEHDEAAEHTRAPPSAWDKAASLGT